MLNNYDKYKTVTPPFITRVVYGGVSLLLLEERLPRTAQWMQEGIELTLGIELSAINRPPSIPS